MGENNGDVVIEGHDAGQDTVLSLVDYTLAAHVVQLQLVRANEINSFGNRLDNNLVGSDGDNILAGREGSDTLTGGIDEYMFRFDRTAGAGNVDTITEFSRNTDTIQRHAGGHGAGGQRRSTRTTGSSTTAPPATSTTTRTARAPRLRNSSPR